MSWFKLDDKSTFSAKVVAAGNQAWGAFCRAGAWSSDHGKDGFFTTEVATVIEPSHKVWARLETVGLIVKADGGWQMPTFLDFNPSAAQVAARRISRANAGSIGGRTKAKGLANAKQVLDVLLEPCLPVATSMVVANVYPDPDPVPKKRRDKRARTPNHVSEGEPCPDPTNLDAVDWLGAHGLPALDSDTGAEVFKFLSHHYEKSTLARSWPGRWATWRTGWDRYAPHAVGPAPGHERIANVLFDLDEQQSTKDRLKAENIARLARFAAGGT